MLPLRKSSTVVRIRMPRKPREPQRPPHATRSDTQAMHNTHNTHKQHRATTHSNPTTHNALPPEPLTTASSHHR
jgi:hypothetical protein